MKKWMKSLFLPLLLAKTPTVAYFTLSRFADQNRIGYVFDYMIEHPSLLLVLGLVEAVLHFFVLTLCFSHPFAAPMIAMAYVAISTLWISGCWFGLAAYADRHPIDNAHGLLMIEIVVFEFYKLVVFCVLAPAAGVFARWKKSRV